jgi:hypothetical protein
MDYKEEQKKYRDMYKDRGKFLWLSKLQPTVINGKVIKNPLTKGRTYVKPKDKDGDQ